MRRNRTLRSRLFSWFVGAILLAMGTSALVAFSARPESATGADAMARHVAERLADTWDDPEATRTYVAEVRDVTGFEAHLLHEPHIPAHVRRLAQHGIPIAPDGPQHMFIPVVRRGAIIGALEMQRFGLRAAPWTWWRLGLTLFLVVVVLSAMAGGVANQLARPLERLAQAADRLGGGDLAFRTDVAGSGRRWVAREVEEVAVSFNRMADRVEAMIRGQRELLGAISHELRSPLGRARVALEIARDRLPADAGERTPAAALDDVERQLGAVDSILGDLLDVTRAGLSDLRKERRIVADWIRQRIAEEPTPPVIDLRVDPGAQDFEVAFDPPLLARAFHNLLLNARAHGHPEASPIEVQVAREGGRLCVTVRDHGPGFPEGLGDKAFEPFVRGDPSRARLASGAGHGLGLAIVHRIVEAHGGRTFARNAAGGGAEVGFDLP